MKLHGVDLVLIRQWSPKAAATYELITGVYHRPSTLVSKGVNVTFSELIELERANPSLSPKELEAAYYRNRLHD